MLQRAPSTRDFSAWFTSTPPLQDFGFQETSSSTTTSYIAAREESTETFLYIVMSKMNIHSDMKCKSGIDLDSLKFTFLWPWRNKDTKFLPIRNTKDSKLHQFLKYTNITIQGSVSLDIVLRSAMSVARHGHWYAVRNRSSDTTTYLGINKSHPGLAMEWWALAEISLLQVWGRWITLKNEWNKWITCHKSDPHRSKSWSDLVWSPHLFHLSNLKRVTLKKASVKGRTGHQCSSWAYPKIADWSEQEYSAE